MSAIRFMALKHKSGGLEESPGSLTYCFCILCFLFVAIYVFHSFCFFVSLDLFRSIKQIRGKHVRLLYQQYLSSLLKDIQEETGEVSRSRGVKICTCKQ